MIFCSFIIGSSINKGKETPATAQGLKKTAKKAELTRNITKKESIKNVVLFKIHCMARESLPMCTHSIKTASERDKIMTKIAVRMMENFFD